MVAENLLMSAVFAQVALTFWAILSMGRARIRALKSKQTRLSSVTVDTAAYPDDVRLKGNNLRNQFETPVLFYAAAAMALISGAVGWVIALLAVAFVLTRIVHRIIHVGKNNVVHRFNVFLIGLVCLALMWIALAVQYFGSAP